MPDTAPQDLAMLAIPNGFSPIHRFGMPPHGEWMAVLRDNTEIVVADRDGRPDPLGIGKAIAIVQSRAYLEARARRLLAPLGKDDGQWRLVAIDFGMEAQYDGCEFLMCFAFEAVEAVEALESGLCGTGPYVEVGFALSAGAGSGSMFVLAIRSIARFSE